MNGLKLQNKNRSSKTIFTRGKSIDDNCIAFKCQNSTDSVRIIREPPVFRLSQPPNPLKFFNLNELFDNYEINEYSKERFLLYFLNYHHNEDSKEKCNSLRIQLLADDEFESKNLLDKTGSRIIDLIDNTSKKTFQISRNTTKINLASTTRLINNYKNTLSSNNNLNESSNFFNFFNIVLFSFTIILLLGLILLVVYLIFIKKKSNYKKKSVLSSDSTYLSNNSSNNQKLLQNKNLVINDLNNQSLNEQYQHLLDTSHMYNCMNESANIIPPNFFYNSTQNYVIKNIKNENVLFKTLNPNCSTSSTSSSSSNPKSSSTATSALTNSMPNYNSFKHQNVKNKKVETLNRKCSCVSSTSTSSNCSNSSSILIKPSINQPESCITLMKQKHDYATPQHHHQNIGEFCISPYQPIIMDINTGATISPYNIIETNTLNKVALICSQDQQFNTPKLVKILNLPNYCTSCVHHVQQVSINSQNYMDTDQHYVNNFNDDKIDGEQVYEIIDVENENEEMKNNNMGFNQKMDASSLRKKYPRTNPNYISINKT